MSDQRVLLSVKGSVQSIAAWDPEAEPVKLWEGHGSPQTGPPIITEFPGDPIIGRVLDVIEELDNGTFRRTLWRLP